MRRAFRRRMCGLLTSHRVGMWRPARSGSERACWCRGNQYWTTETSSFRLAQMTDWPITGGRNGMIR